MHHAREGIVGRPVDEAVTAITTRDADRTPAAVREALDPVTADGRVTRAAIREAVSDTSKVVATAETRVELAANALAEARQTATPVTDLPTVAVRLDEFADRLAAVEARVASLDVDRLAADVSSPDAVYALAIDCREIAARAQGIVRTADELQVALERFETWLTTPKRRYDAFEEDIAIVRESVTELEAAVDALGRTDDPVIDWADATMRIHVIDLLVADLRAECDDLRTWADREGEPFRATLGETLTALDCKQSALADRLADRSRPAWRDRFGDDIDALAAALDGFAPPVDWAAVEDQLAAHRSRAFDTD